MLRGVNLEVSERGAGDVEFVIVQRQAVGRVQFGPFVLVGQGEGGAVGVQAAGRSFLRGTRNHVPAVHIRGVPDQSAPSGRGRYNCHALLSVHPPPQFCLCQGAKTESFFLFLKGVEGRLIVTEFFPVGWANGGQNPA